MKGRYSFWVLLFVLVVLRVVIFYFTKPNYPDGTRLKISTIVNNEPSRYDTSQAIDLEGIKTYLPKYPEVNYGDKVVVEGTLEGGKIKKGTLLELEESKGVLYTFRKAVIDFYTRHLPTDHAALVAGMTIGSKSNISSEFWDKLKTSGTAHVVVASGMNVTLVAEFLVSFFIVYFPRRKGIPFALAGIWGYSLMSGFEAPIVRAAIMGSVTFTAQELGRLISAWRALIVSAFVMLIAKPEWLTDLGFILSFVATASLMLFSKRIIKYLKNVPNFLREDLATTLAAQIGVAPILFVTFGQFNLLSPIINALVLWTVVPVTMIGMLAGVLGIVFEPIGTILLYLTYPLTSWFIFVTGIF